MRKISRTLAGLAALALMAIPAAAGAQEPRTFVVTPFAAVYAPTADLGAFSASAGNAGADVTLRQKAGFAFGANATYWFTRRMAIEFGGAYALSDAKASGAVFGTDDDFAGSATEDASVIMGSVKAMFNLMPPESRFNLRLGIGPAIVRQGGDAYDFGDGTELQNRTNYGGALSLCSRVNITPNVGIRLRAEDYMYQTRLKYHDPTDPSSDFSFEKKFQNDLLLSAGLQFTLPKMR